MIDVELEKKKHGNQKEALKTNNNLCENQLRTSQDLCVTQYVQGRRSLRIWGK
jgi:hypothetical protein